MNSKAKTIEKLNKLQEKAKVTRKGIFIGYFTGNLEVERRRDLPIIPPSQQTGSYRSMKNK